MAIVPIGRRLSDLAAAHHDRPALTIAPLRPGTDTTFTRRELDRRTNRLARHFARLGVEAGSYVSIACPNGAAFVESAFAAWKLGAVPQPLSHRLPEPERRAILDLVRPALLVDGPIEAPMDCSDAPLPDSIAPEWKAPTSGGSTGRPKVIVDTRPGVTDTERTQFRIPFEQVALVPGPLYHNGPFQAAARAMLAGNHTVVMVRFDAEQMLALIERYRVTWTMVVPTMMHRIWALGPETRARYDLSSLQCVYHIAAPIAEWLKREWIGWLGADRVWELYSGTERQASTEVGGAEWLTRPGTVGRPIYGEVRIVDEHGVPCPPGEVGLIQLRAPAADRPTYRYLGAPSAAAPDGWDTLGDIGWMDEDGYLFMADRRTDLILRGGANVYPAEVEHAIDSHPAVGSSAVVGLPDEDLGQRVHAVVYATAPVTPDELRAHVATLLAPYKVPASVELVDEPVRDDAGKVRRSELRARRVATGGTEPG